MPGTASSSDPHPSRILLVAAALALLSALPYLHGLGNGFIGMDDPEYVTGNPQVLRGLTWDGMVWAFGTFHSANWHPLTWLSHMADVSLFGTDPRGHHLVSLLLHALSTGLLFLALVRMTGSPRPSAFVAALFGVHPLHVESVAWVAERKDLLAGLLFMLVLLAYDRFARRGGTARFLAVAALLALGLTAKPMLVTVPFVLLLLDVWPLGRTTWAAPADGREWNPLPPRRLLLEKAPLLALSAASGIVTFLAQRSSGAVSDLGRLSVAPRAANAVASYAIYLIQTVWPSGLAVYYPLPPEWRPSASHLAALLLLLALSWAAFALFRRAPYVAVGWLWYLGMLVPVIGIVQVGSQAHADRYTYLPLIGIFVAVAWLAPLLAPGGRRATALLTAGACAVVIALSAASWVQVGWWRDSLTLFGRTLAVTSGNWIAAGNMGVALYEAGRYEEAVARYREAIALWPSYPEAHNNLGNALDRLGRRDEALLAYGDALRSDPGYAPAHGNLGMALLRQGRTGEALVHLREALRLRPDSPEAHYDLAEALGDSDEAVDHFLEALRLRPDLPEAHLALGNILVRRGDVDRAMARFREALALRPGYAEAHSNIGFLLMRRGDLDGAVASYREAVRLRPDLYEAHAGLSLALTRLGRQEEARPHLEAARRLRAAGIPPLGPR